MTSEAVLIADITGSTTLYERDGNARALREIGQCLARLQDAIGRAGGTFVNSKGDDVLALFAKPEPAFLATCEILTDISPGGLAIHAGLCAGDVVRQEGDVFGTPVNTAARLAAMAKPGELLLDGGCRPMLTDESRARLRPVGAVLLKGKAAPTDVYSYVAADSFVTEAEVVPVAHRSDRASSVHLSLRGSDFTVRDGEVLSIGRSRDCDLVVGEAWVSRHHATVSVARGLVELTDHSSTGSYVRAGDGHEYAIRRQTMALHGRGTISVGAPTASPGEIAITYEVHHVADRIARTRQAD